MLRTRVALGNALVALMLEHKFEDISVQQVLARAGVGRATFYAHFANKRDLLLSDADRFYAALDAHFVSTVGDSRRVAPVAELFAHVAEFDAFQRALARDGLRDTLFDLFTDYLAGTIERRIAILVPRPAARALARPAAARVFAGALVELLRWWLNQTSRPSARAMDDQFHAIVWSGLAGVAAAP